MTPTALHTIIYLKKKGTPPKWIPIKTRQFFNQSGPRRSLHRSGPRTLTLYLLVSVV